MVPGVSYLPEAPLSITQKGLALSTAGLLGLLRAGLTELGVLDVCAYGTHSQRIGGASARPAAGASLLEVAAVPSSPSSRMYV